MIQNLPLYSAISHGSREIYQDRSGLIRFEFTTRGITGQQITEWCKVQNIEINPNTEACLRHIEPTAHTLTKVAVLPAEILNEKIISTSHAYDEAHERELISLNAEAAYYIFETFSEKLWEAGFTNVLIMSDALRDDLEDQCLLQIGKGFLHALRLKSIPRTGLDQRTGFVFAIR